MSSESGTEQQAGAPTSAATNIDASSTDSSTLSAAQQRRQEMKTPEYQAWWANKLTDRIWLPKPNLWQRFQDQMQGKASTVGPDSVSGANITLEDVAREPEVQPRSLDDLSDQGPGNNPIDDVLNQDSDEWFGEPDPTIYAPGTTNLSPEEIEREIKKGNIIRVGEFKRMLKDAYSWEKEAAADMVLQHILKERVWIKLDNGKRVSFLDLWGYVHNNPELKALAERDVPVVVDGQQPDEQQISPWDVQRHYQQLMSSPEVQQHLPWGIVARGDVWKRRPTRWLKGLDGLRDFGYAFYVHENAAAGLLGPKWANKPPQQVAADPAYMAEVVERGPEMGASLMFTAARELPFDECRDAWVQKLQQTLLRRNPEGGEAAQVRCAALQAMFDRQLVGQHTQLLDSTGQNLRQGSTLLMTTMPNDRLFVQAISPGGSPTEREYYQVGDLQDGELCRALLDMFIGEQAVDTQFRERAKAGMLYYINGLKMRTKQMIAADLGPHAPRAPRNPRRYLLPPVGAERASTLVNNVQQRVLHYKVAEAFEGAVAAALAVPQAGSRAAVLQARRLAAEEHLRGTLGALGLDVSNLRLPAPPAGLLDEAQELVAK